MEDFVNLFLVCCECGNECVRVCARKPGCVTLGCVCGYAHRSGECVAVWLACLSQGVSVY